MKRVSNFIVERKTLIFVVVILLTVFCGLLATKVSINSDMSKYLPKNSQMKIGQDIMAKEFNNDVNTLNVMFSELDDNQKSIFSQSLSEIEGVDSVAYDNSEKYNKDGYTLYVLSIGYSVDADETKAVMNTVKEQYVDYDFVMGGSAAGNSVLLGLFPKMIGIAFIIILIILFLMCNSWIEPLLFLVSTGVAVLINMGTNIIFGSVSDITFSIAPILQLVVSIDYSIMLLNRYKQEKQVDNNKTEAMKKALQRSFSAISSSSITTIVGMLALVFMSFTIGRDFGFVLAKGVLFSLICIFTILPAMVLIFDNLIEKTAKKSLPINMNKIGSLSFHIRKAMPIVFIALLVGSFILRGGVAINYTMTDFDSINKVFTPDNTFVVLYQNKDEDKIATLVEKIDKRSDVNSVNAYCSTLGKRVTYNEMASAVNMDENIIALMYYSYFEQQGEVEQQKIAPGVFMQYLQTDIATNPLFEKFLTQESMAQLATLGGAIPQGQIAMYDFIQYLLSDIVNNELYKPFFTADNLEQLDDTKYEMNKGMAQLVGNDYSRMIINTNLAAESEQTTQFITQLNNELGGNDGVYYIMGNSVMAYEMQDSFPIEMNLITIFTVIVILMILAIAFRSLSVPLILVLIIQGAVFITMGLASIGGDRISYLALLIVQCLLLGATVDYGILLTSYYKELRCKLDIKEALITALNQSIHTILTSALILVIVTGLLGFYTMNSNPATSEILMLIAEGGIVATILVVFILPGLLAAMDRFVIKQSK
ncbi:MAG: RND family transporter [Vulcanibacillus sp.]